MTAQTMKDAAVAYKNLTDDERKYYQEIGLQATLAAQAGVAKPFGVRPRKREHHDAFAGEQQPGNVRDDGVIVLANDPNRERLQLVEYASRNFHDDLSLIRQKFRHLTKQDEEAEQAEDQAVRDNSVAIMESVPKLMPDAPEHNAFQHCHGSNMEECNRVTYEPPVLDVSIVPWPWFCV